MKSQTKKGLTDKQAKFLGYVGGCWMLFTCFTGGPLWTWTIIIFVSGCTIL